MRGLKLLLLFFKYFLNRRITIAEILYVFVAEVARGAFTLPVNIIIEEMLRDSYKFEEI